MKISAVYSHSKTGAYGIIKFTMYIRLTAKKVISELLFIWCINSMKDTEMRTTQHRQLMICDFLNHQKVNKCHHNTQSLVTFCTQKWITSDSSHLLCFEAVHWHTHTHTHTRLTALCPGLPGWAGTRKVKQIWILLKQETVSGSGIRWAIFQSAPRSRQITTPAPPAQFFTGRMPFLSPNQQCQSTEGNKALKPFTEQQKNVQRVKTCSTHCQMFWRIWSNL